MKVAALTSALTAALVILAPVALANDAASSLRLESDIADREIVALIQNCDPSTGLPIGRKGACTGIESFNGSLSGGLNASYYSEVNFAVLANGEALTTAFDIITGTADGHGSGDGHSVSRSGLISLVINQPRGQPATRRLPSPPVCSETSNTHQAETGTPRRELKGGHIRYP